MRIAQLLAASVMAFVLSVGSNATQAATYYWDNNGAAAGFGTAGGTWGTSANWNTVAAGNVVPTVTNTLSGDDVNFGNGATGLVTGSITVTGTTQAFGAMIFASGSGAITLTGGTLQMAAATTITVNNSTNTINSILAGTGSNLTKEGTGTLILGGVNTYTGTTTVNGGTLTFSMANSTYAGGQININGASIFKVTTGQLIFSGKTFNFDSTGGGTFTADGSNTVTQSNSSFITNGGAKNTINGIGVINIGGAGTATFNITLGSDASTDLSVSPVIFNGAGIAKTGTGRLTLSGANTLTGAVAISAGVLKLGASSATSVSGPLGTPGAGTSVTGTGTLDLNGFSLTSTAAEALSLNGTGTSGSGALVNTSATASTYIGQVTLGGSSSIVATAGNIVLSATGTMTGSGFDLTLAGAATASSIASIIGTTTGALTKNGTGTWTLSGANTYTGLTTISAGTLLLGAAGSGANSPLGTVAAGTVVSGSGASLDLAGFTLATAEPLTINGTGLTTEGALKNVSGTAVTYSGLITLGSDLARISSSSGSITLSNTGTITGSGFTLQLAGAGNGSLASIIGTGTGGLSKLGAGTWTLTGSSTFTGNTSFNNGKLKLGVATALQNSALDTTNTSATIGLDVTGFVTPTLGGLVGSVNLAIAINTGYGSVTGLTLNPQTGSTVSYSGVIANGAAGMTLTKTGAGTQILSGVNTYTGTTTITDGTLQLGVANAVSSSSAVTISGGTFSTGLPTGVNTGFSVLVGALKVTGSGSTINLGTGVHTLTFASLDAAGITSLTIKGFTSLGAYGTTGAQGKIIFSSTTNFTPIFLSNITFDGFPFPGATLIAGGELVPAPEPTALLGLGVLGLLLLRRKV